MTDDEVIENLHRALVAHEAVKADPASATKAYLKTYEAAAAAEKALKEHFGPDGWKQA